MSRLASIVKWHLVARRIVKSPWIRTIGLYGEACGKVIILLGILAWLWEIPDRAQQRHDAAWTLINIAQGKPGEVGRKKALEGLNSDNVSLAGIDLSRAFLTNVDLTLANLSYANFNEADLTLARFGCSFLRMFWHGRCTNFNHAEFRYTRLDQVDFRYASLQYVTFVGAKNGVFKPNFSHTTIADSVLEDITFRDANFSGALLARTKLSNVQFLNPWNRDASADLFEGTKIISVDLSQTNMKLSMLTSAKLCNVLVEGYLVYNNCDGSANSRSAAEGVR